MERLLSLRLLLYVVCMNLTLQLSYSQSLNNVYRIPHFHIICRNNAHQTFALCKMNNS